MANLFLMTRLNFYKFFKKFFPFSFINFSSDKFFHLRKSAFMSGAAAIKKDNKKIEKKIEKQDKKIDSLKKEIKKIEKKK